MGRAIESNRSGFGVQGLGFRVQGSGFRVHKLVGLENSRLATVPTHATDR